MNFKNVKRMDFQAPTAKILVSSCFSIFLTAFQIEYPHCDLQTNIYKDELCIIFLVCGLNVRLEESVLAHWRPHALL